MSRSVPLWVGELTGPAVQYDARTQQYRLAAAPSVPALRSARVLGVCVKVSNAAPAQSPQFPHQLATQLEIDDGTGVARVRVGPEVRVEQDAALSPGLLIDCLGTISEPWPPTEATRTSRWIDATSVSVVDDRNLEALRMLQIISMRQQDATKQEHAGSRLQLELSPFPSVYATGAKRKRSAASPLVVPQQQNLVFQEGQSKSVGSLGHSARPATVIEKPVDARSSSATGSQVPPAEYQFKVPPADHDLIARGVKTLEIRLNVTPYSIIRVGDRINVNAQTVATVAAVRKYTQLASVLQTEDLSHLLPLSASSSVSAIAAGQRHFRQFFSVAEEEQHGLVVFQLAVATSNAQSSALATEEEWSKHIYNHLSARRDAGCSMAELRFAFPMLPVQQISDVLADLQMDGVVYIAQDKYRLL